MNFKTLDEIKSYLKTFAMVNYENNLCDPEFLERQIYDEPIKIENKCESCGKDITKLNNDIGFGLFFSFDEDSVGRLNIRLEGVYINKITRRVCEGMRAEDVVTCECGKIDKTKAVDNIYNNLIKIKEQLKN